VVCLVGGWWPYKDIAVLDAALARLKEPLHLVVTGSPLDEAVLERWRSLPGLRVHTVPGPVSDAVLRLVYAAAGAALVTRRPGTGKESGLVMDAARLGVPLIISEHDGALTTRLHGQSWALTFPVGDPDALADALHTVIRQPPEYPGPEAPGLLGMRTAAEQADSLTRTFAPLRTKDGQAAREAGGLPPGVALGTAPQAVVQDDVVPGLDLHANALTVTPEALDDFFARFDAPADDEDVIVYTGDLDVLVTALTEARGR
jgi:hypothetical protein